MSRLKQIGLMALLAFMPFRVNAQLVAVSTDMAFLVTQNYNIAAEMTIGNQSTLGLSVLGNYHPWILKSMRAIAIQPEWRYYFSGRPMMRHFIGIGGLFANYNFEWDGVHYVGDAAGAGLTFGYVLPLSERFNLDFHAGVGLVFYYGEKEEVGNVILPTKIGISLSYIIR